MSVVKMNLHLQLKQRHHLTRVQCRGGDVRAGVREPARGAVVAGVRGVPGGSADRTRVAPQHGTQHAAVARLEPVAGVDLGALSVLPAEAAHGFLARFLLQASHRPATDAGSARGSLTVPRARRLELRPRAS